MFPVTTSQVTLVKDGFFGEHMNLGLIPGEWPSKILLINNKGEGVLFNRSLPVIQLGKFVGFNYQTENSIDLTVFEN
ncbi:MAG: hypothetical protein UV64_C0007G0042 [Parcubacteria group bacterium GW2011_GWC1_43_11b]|nr:MAG: hypothetical protein UV64_C0007G0042 [Parcubacteria group bacterium GW2011_GWC1_43_11b]